MLLREAEPRAPDAELQAELERLRTIEAAARNLVAQRGRHNTETAYRRLVDALTER